jgi:A/G-specific adenine glycosylase
MLKQKRNTIIKWFNKHQRMLPWRQTKDAYKIWLSEIILQQTRVQQGLPYYQKFVEHYPNVKLLASAEEDMVLHLWQGLGYYSRARNMHFSAKIIEEKFHGVFPSNYADIRKLKGVGDYTAAAIASFAFDLPYVAIDGNVMRVISRLFGIEEDIQLNSTKKAITAIAQQMMGNSDPALFNQSMMEFGALQCTAASPNCLDCPLQDDCFALKNNKVTQLPLKINKTKIRSRYFNYLIIKTQDSAIYIRRRTRKDIWQNLYEFPLVESENRLSVEELMAQIHQQEICKSAIDISLRTKEIKHKLSHQLLHIRFNIIRCKSLKISPKWIKIPLEEIADYPFPEVINKNKEHFI